MELLPFQSFFPKMKLVSDPGSFFSSLKSEFQDYYQHGFFEKTPTDGIYIYEMSVNGVLHKGIVACIPIDEIRNNNVLKHEKTIAAKEQIMVKILLKRKAMIKPVLLAYKDVQDIKLYLDDIVDGIDPDYSFNIDTKDHHKIWVIKDGSKIARIQELFKDNVSKGYIADGHHRCSASLTLNNSAHDSTLPAMLDNLLCAFFPFKELKIGDFNRIIDIKKKVSPIKFIAALTNFAKIEPMNKPSKPKKKHEMVILIKKEWLKVKWKKEVLEKYSDRPSILDTDILNNIILKGILKIKDVRTDESISYADATVSLSSFREKVGKINEGLGILLYPINSEDLIAYADQNMTLPPKSTFFEPRIKNGIFTKLLDA